MVAAVAGPEERGSIEDGRRKVRKWLFGFFVLLPPPLDLEFSPSLSRESADVI